MADKDKSAVDVMAPAIAAAAVVAGVGKTLVDRRRGGHPTADPSQQPAGPRSTRGEAGRGGDRSGDRAERHQVPEHPDEQPDDQGHQPSDGNHDGRKPSFLDRVAQRVPLLRRPVQVQERFNELHGNNLAAAVTLQSFLALFPLLLVVVAVVGFFSAHSSTDVPGRIAHELGLRGEAANAVRDAVGAARRSRRAASIVGLAGLFWSGLGLVAALQYAFNQVWQVEDRGVKDKAFGVLWLGGAALLFVGSAAATTALRWMPGVVSPVSAAVTVVVTFALWLWTAKLLPNRDVGWKALVPGALLGTVGLELLKVIGAYYVPRLVSSSSELYGSIGVVFAILAWLLLFSRLIVYSAVLNVVLHEGRAGTIKAVVEVPRAVQPDSTPDVSRSGRRETQEAPA